MAREDGPADPAGVEQRNHVGRKVLDAVTDRGRTDTSATSRSARKQHQRRTGGSATIGV